MGTELAAEGAGGAALAGRASHHLQRAFQDGSSHFGKQQRLRQDGDGFQQAQLDEVDQRRLIRPSRRRRVPRLSRKEE